MVEAYIVSDINIIERDEIMYDMNESPAETPNPALDALVSAINAMTAYNMSDMKRGFLSAQACYATACTSLKGVLQEWGSP